MNKQELRKKYEELKMRYDEKTIYDNEEIVKIHYDICDLLQEINEVKNANYSTSHSFEHTAFIYTYYLTKEDYIKCYYFDQLTIPDTEFTPFALRPNGKYDTVADNMREFVNAVTLFRMRYNENNEGDGLHMRFEFYENGSVKSAVLYQAEGDWHEIGIKFQHPNVSKLKNTNGIWKNEIGQEYNYFSNQWVSYERKNK